MPSSPGFFGSKQPGRGGGGIFVIGRIMTKLGKLVMGYKLYLLMGFWWVNWLLSHNDVIAYGVSV